MHKKIHLLSLGALLLGTHLSLHASHTNDLVEEEQSLRLFKSDKGKVIPATRVNSFLSSHFITKPGFLAIKGEIDEAVELLGKLAQQFVTEIALREQETEFFWSAYKTVAEKTLANSTSVSTLYTVGAYTFPATVLAAIDNALLSKIKPQKKSVSPEEASEASSFMLTHSHNAFSTVKNALCMSLLTILQKAGEDVSEELKKFKTIPTPSKEAIEDDEDLSEDLDDELIKEEIEDYLKNLQNQRDVFLSVKSTHQSLMAEVEQIEKLKEDMPKKEFVLKSFLEFIGVENHDYETVKKYLLESEETPAFRTLDVRFTQKTLPASTPVKLLDAFQKHVAKSSGAASSYSMTPIDVSSPNVPQTIEVDTPETEDLEEKCDALSALFDKNRRMISQLNKTISRLNGDLEKTTKEIKDQNEPIEKILSGLYAFLGGTDYSQFLNVFAFKSDPKLKETLTWKRGLFPKSGKDFIESFWRFMRNGE